MRPAVEPAAAGRHGASASSVPPAIGAIITSTDHPARCPMRLSVHLFYGARARLVGRHAGRFGFARAAVPGRLAARSGRVVPARTASARPWPGPARSGVAHAAASSGPRARHLRARALRARSHRQRGARPAPAAEDAGPRTSVAESAVGAPGGVSSGEPGRGAGAP
jgi:hypothetical protein